MRISDWSSDVCSSDLCTRYPRAAGRERGSFRPGARRCEPVGMIIPPGPLKVMVATKPVDFRKGAVSLAALVEHELGLKPFSGEGFELADCGSCMIARACGFPGVQLGRASCRERVWQYV